MIFVVTLLLLHYAHVRAYSPDPFPYTFLIQFLPCVDPGLLRTWYSASYEGCHVNCAL